MAKKNRGKRANPPTTRAADESIGLLRFVQQLSRDQQFPEALRAAQTLIEKDPLNPLSHAVMGSLLLQMSQPHEAIRRFEMAVHFGMDRNPEILRSLAITSTLAGYPFLGAQTARAALALDLTEEQRALCTTIATAAENLLPELIGKQPIDPETAERAALLVEQTNRALYNEDLDRAKSRALEATKVAPAWPYVWNTYASLLFGEGDVEGAIGALLEAKRLAAMPDQMITLSLIRMYSVVGRQDEAEALVEAMIADPAAYGVEEDGLGRAEAVLGRDQAVFDFLHPFLESGNKLSILTRYLLGAAAANLGKPDIARAAWRNLAREGLTQVRPFGELLGRNEQPPTLDGRFPYLAAIELAPRKVLDTIFKEGQSDPDVVDLTSYTASFPRLPEALCEPLTSQTVNVRLTVELLLRLPKPAVGALTRFAGSRLSSDHERLYAHLTLRGAGYADRAEPASVWIGGRRREWVLPGFRLRATPPPDQTEETRALFGEAQTAQQAGDIARALELYTRIVADDPESKEAEHNLGTALMLSGRMDEGEQHLRHALAIDEGYVLARTNLAGLEMARGNLGAARQLLTPLEQRVDFAVEELLAYLRARGDLAEAEGEPAQAEMWFHCLLAYDPENQPTLERLAALNGAATK